MKRLDIDPLKYLKSYDKEGTDYTYKAKEVKLKLSCDDKLCFSDKIFDQNFGEFRSIAILIETSFTSPRPKNIGFQEFQKDGMDAGTYQENSILIFCVIGFMLIFVEYRRMKKNGYKTSVKFMKTLKGFIIVNICKYERN